MISKSEKKKLIKELGKYYTEPVRQLCEAQNKRNKLGEIHSASSITNVMNGKPHEELEALIYEAYAIKKQQRLTNKKRRKELLNTKKPEADTSGSI